jgi:hypothetical protein
MKRKPFPGIIGGLLGFIAGAVGGAYLGLVLGGTFLGSLDIYENTGFEGYELAAYVGSAIGSITAIFIGVVLAYRITKRREKTII